MGGITLGKQPSARSRLAVCREGHHPCVQRTGRLCGCDANAKRQGDHRLFVCVCVCAKIHGLPHK